MDGRAQHCLRTKSWHKGVAKSTNTPGKRSEVKSGWVDSLNNLWMFGGSTSGATNDLWKYNTTTNLWNWVKGDSSSGAAGKYGARGVEKSTNLPPSGYTYTKWKDDRGNFYVFGGTGTGGSNNDIWRYNPHSNNWTWIVGDSFVGDSGHYIKRCQYGHGNMPCARYENQTPQTECCNPTFWTMGGFSGCSAHPGVYNDLWVFDYRTNQWCWVSGKPESDSGHYGTPGKGSSTNAIGSRGGMGIWTDSLNHLWVFGGYNFNFSAQLNDMWEFIPDTTCVPLGHSSSVENIPSSSIKPEVASVYPNPANNSIFFDRPALDEKVVLSFTTIDGKLIKQIVVTGSHTEISTVELADGMYIITMTSQTDSKSWKVNVFHN